MACFVRKRYRSQQKQMRGIARAKDASTSRHAGESEAGCPARHWTTRPPPAGTLPHSVRTSAPHADRNTKITSRGRIGRSIMGVAAGAAPGLRGRGSSARGRRCRAAGDRVNGLPAMRRELSLILLQTFQRRCAAGRYARAMRHVIGTAGAADRGSLCAARLFGRAGRRNSRSI